MTILTSIQGGTNTGIDQLPNWTRSGVIGPNTVTNCPPELNPFFVTGPTGVEFRYNHTPQSGQNIPVAEYEFAAFTVLDSYTADDIIFGASQGGIEDRGLEIFRTADDLQVVLTRDNGPEAPISLGTEIETGTPFHLTVRLRTNTQDGADATGQWEVWINGERKGFEDNVNWSTDQFWNNWNSIRTGAPLVFFVDTNGSTTGAWNHLVFRDGFSTSFGTEPEYVDAQEDNTAVVVPQSFFSGHWGLAPPPPAIEVTVTNTFAGSRLVFVISDPTQADVSAPAVVGQEYIFTIPDHDQGFRSVQIHNITYQNFQGGTNSPFSQLTEGIGAVVSHLEEANPGNIVRVAYTGTSWQLLSFAAPALPTFLTTPLI